MVATPLSTNSSPADTEALVVGHERAGHERLRRIASEQYEFVWRSLRRLGVRPPETDDAAQQVFVILAKKSPSIEIGHERSYVFAIAMRVAANARRRARSRREVPEDEAASDPTFLPAVETENDDERARAVAGAGLAVRAEAGSVRGDARARSVRGRFGRRPLHSHAERRRGVGVGSDRRADPSAYVPKKSGTWLARSTAHVTKKD